MRTHPAGRKAATPAYLDIMHWHLVVPAHTMQAWKVFSPCSPVHTTAGFVKLCNRKLTLLLPLRSTRACSPTGLLPLLQMLPVLPLTEASHRSQSCKHLPQSNRPTGVQGNLQGTAFVPAPSLTCLPASRVPLQRYDPTKLVSSPVR